MGLFGFVDKESEAVFCDARGGQCSLHQNEVQVVKGVGLRFPDLRCTVPGSDGVRHAYIITCDIIMYDCRTYRYCTWYKSYNYVNTHAGTCFDRSVPGICTFGLYPSCTYIQYC